MRRSNSNYYNIKLCMKLEIKNDVGVILLLFTEQQLLDSFIRSFLYAKQSSSLFTNIHRHAFEVMLKRLDIINYLL